MSKLTSDKAIIEESIRIEQDAEGYFAGKGGTMRHTPEKLDRIIEAVRRHNAPEPYDNGLEKLIALGLPHADRETIKRHCDLLRKQAEVVRATERQKQAIDLELKFKGKAI